MVSIDHDLALAIRPPDQLTGRVQRYIRHTDDETRALPASPPVSEPDKPIQPIRKEKFPVPPFIHSPVKSANDLDRSTTQSNLPIYLSPANSKLPFRITCLLMISASASVSVARLMRLIQSTTLLSVPASISFSFSFSLSSMTCEP